MPQEPILPQFTRTSCRKEKPPLLRSERVYVKKLEALLTSLWAACGWSFQGLHPVAGGPAMVVELGERCRKPGSDDGEPVLEKNPGNLAHSSFATVLRPSYSLIELPLVPESNMRIAKIVTLDFAFVAGKPVKAGWRRVHPGIAPARGLQAASVSERTETGRWAGGFRTLKRRSRRAPARLQSEPKVGRVTPCAP